jgi:hypothetical protein
VRLLVERTIIVIVPLITSFLINAVRLLASVVNPVACISAANDVTQISIIPILPSAVFLLWSETIGQVPVRNLSVVKLVTPYFAIMVEGPVNHGCYIQHRLEALYICIDFFIVIRQVGCQLVAEHP